MTTIGGVDFVVGAQASPALLAESKLIGVQAGRAAKKGFDGEFSNIGAELAAHMRDNGELSGISFTDSMERSVKSHLGGITQELADTFRDPQGLDKAAEKYGSVNNALTELRNKLQAANEAGLLSDHMWNRLGGTLNQWVGKARPAEKELQKLAAEAENMRTFETAVAHALDGLTPRWEENTAALKKNSGAAGDNEKAHKSLWQLLSFNARQAIVIGAAIASTAGDISTLGAALGGAATIAAASLAKLASASLSSLTVVGSALGDFGIGVGVAIGAIRVLNRDADKVPESLRPAAKAFEDLKNSFGTLNEAIATAAFQNAAPVFKSLQDTVVKLTPAFEVMGKAVGTLVDEFAKSVGTQQSLGELTKIITAAAPVFVTLSQAAGNLAIAFGNIWIAAQPFVTTFAAAIGDIAKRFATWTGSLAGKNALADFFAKGQALMGGFLDGVGHIGDALFNIFKIASPAADAFNGILGGIVKSFDDWTKSVAGKNAISDWLRSTQVILPHLADLVVALGKGLADLVTPKTVSTLIKFLDAMTGLIKPLVDILDALSNLDALGLLSTLLEDLFKAIDPLTPALSTIASAIGSLFSALAPVAGTLLSTLVLLLAPAIEGIAAIASVFAAAWQAMQPFWQGISDVALALTEVLIPAIGDIISAFVPFVQAVISALTGNQSFHDYVYNTLIPFINGPFKDAVSNIVAKFTDFWSFLTTYVIPVINTVRDAFSNATSKATPLGAAISGIIAAAKPFLSTFGVAFLLGIEGIGNAFRIAVVPINAMIDALNTVLHLLGLAKTAAHNVPVVNTGGGGGSYHITPNAAGGVYTTPHLTLSGEAGPEAIVPLDRPLSQVNPEVRGLSAVAQGLAGAAGGGLGSGIFVAEGAIQVVSPYSNAMLVANQVLDQLVATVSQ